LDTGLTLGADLSPVIRALNAIKNLAKNVNEMKEFSDNGSESRMIYKEQSAALNRQLDELQKKLDRLKRENHESAVDRLLNRYAETGHACEALIKKSEQKHDDCLATKRSFVTLMCGGMKGDMLARCLNTANDTWKC
jgi:DNA-binding transcriptional MerR regulator